MDTEVKIPVWEQPIAETLSVAELIGRLNSDRAARVHADAHALLAFWPTEKGEHPILP